MMKLHNSLYRNSVILSIIFFLILVPLSSSADSLLWKSPLKQIKDGITPENVKCNSGFKLIINSKTNSPACVFLKTKQRLIENGWARYTFPIIFETDKTVYHFDEPIKITMKNVGSKLLETSSQPVGFSIYNENDKIVCTWNGPLLAVGYVDVGETLTFIHGKTLESKNDGCTDIIQRGDYKIQPGIYRLKLDHFYEFGLDKNYDGPIHTIIVK